MRVGKHNDDCGYALDIGSFESRGLRNFIGLERVQGVAEQAVQIGLGNLGGLMKDIGDTFGKERRPSSLTSVFLRDEYRRHVVRRPVFEGQ